MKTITITALTLILTAKAHAFAGREGGGAGFCDPVAEKLVSAVVDAQTGNPGEITSNRLVGAVGPGRIYQVSVESQLGPQTYRVTLAGGACVMTKIELLQQ